MKKNTLYMITWQTEDGERSGLYTWDGKGITTSKDKYIRLTRDDLEKTQTKPISVSSLKESVYSAVMDKDIDISDEIVPK